MGADKARLPYPAGLAMAVTVAATLSEVCQSVALVRRGEADGLPWMDAGGDSLTVLRDVAGADAHPLWGVYTALQHCPTEWALVVPCDVPHLRREDVERLVVEGCSNSSGGVAWDGERVHPLVGVFRSQWADAIAAHAMEGKAATRFMASARKVPLPSASLRNINRWSDTGLPHPLELLCERLGVVDPLAQRRLMDGERMRLARQGMVLPLRGLD